MPIFAKNIIVGGKQIPPANNEEKPVVKKPVFGKVIVKSDPVVQTEAEQTKYIKKQDGELVRHINTKSDYLRDVFELD